MELSSLPSKIDIALTDPTLVALAVTDANRFKEVYRSGLEYMKTIIHRELDVETVETAFDVLVTPHVEVVAYKPDDAIKRAVEDERFAESYLPKFHPLYNGSIKKNPQLLQKALWLMENVPGFDELLEQYNEQRVRSMSSDPSGAFHIDTRTFNTLLSANHELRRLHEEGRDVRFDMTLGYFHAEGKAPHTDNGSKLMNRQFDRVSGIYYGKEFPDHKYTATTREVERRLKEES